MEHSIDMTRANKTEGFSDGRASIGARHQLRLASAGSLAEAGFPIGGHRPAAAARERIGAAGAAFRIHGRRRISRRHARAQGLDCPAGHALDPAIGQIVSTASWLRSYGATAWCRWRAEQLPARFRLLDALPEVSSRPADLAGSPGRRYRRRCVQPASPRREARFASILPRRCRRVRSAARTRATGVSCIACSRTKGFTASGSRRRMGARIRWSSPID